LPRKILKKPKREKQTGFVQSNFNTGNSKTGLDMSGSSKNKSIEKSFNWLSAQNIASVKELARTVSAHALWDLPNPYTVRLILEKKNGAWNTSVRESARACSALADAGIILRDAEKWLLSKKTGSSWNENVYDTAYALKALGDMEISELAGCTWLYENYGPDWEQVGTTALILMALQRQVELIEKERKGKEREKEIKKHRAFIKERANWLLLKREPDGGWRHISTSNLIIQALLLSGFKEEVNVSLSWLKSKVRESGAWGNKKDDINASALSLITLGMSQKRPEKKREFIPM